MIRYRHNLVTAAFKSMEDGWNKKFTLVLFFVQYKSAPTYAAVGDKISIPVFFSSPSLNLISIGSKFSPLNFYSSALRKFILLPSIKLPSTITFHPSMCSAPVSSLLFQRRSEKLLNGNTIPRGAAIEPRPQIEGAKPDSPFRTARSFPRTSFLLLCAREDRWSYF